MTIKHIMKDGRVLDSIAGYVVTKEDCPQVYDLIDRLNQEGAKHEKKNKKQDFENSDSDRSDCVLSRCLLSGQS